jgi:ribosome-associated toxin RatA of RatAB toxin-antitoxin module
MKKYFIIATAIFSLILISFSYAAKEVVKPVAWKNPTPSIHDFALDIEQLVEIIGKGQLIISHKPREIELWTQGKPKNYKNVRFSSAMTLIDAPVETLRKQVLDIKNYEAFMPQIRKAKILSGTEENFIAAYTQQYYMGPVPLKSKFEWQYNTEENGDISFLLHKGDVDAAAGRYEFIPVNEQNLPIAWLPKPMLISKMPFLQQQQ